MSATKKSPTIDDIHSLVVTLNDSTGLSLVLAEDSISIDDGYAVATALSKAVAAEGHVALEAVAKVFISESDDGDQATWSLVFFYLDGKRVAPQGFSHMTFVLDEKARWRKVGWEADEYGEWAEMDAIGAIGNKSS